MRYKTALQLPWRVVQHLFPILRWLPAYELRSYGVSDVLAGVILSLLSAPESIAYASIAGLPPIAGLYTSVCAPAAYALAGSSPQLVTGPTTIMSILTQKAMPTTWAGEQVLPGTPLYANLASLLALVCGCVHVCMSALRAAFLARLISPAVVLGFTSGSAFLIASTQFSTVLGVPKCVSPSGTCNFAQAVANVHTHAHTIRYPVPLAALACIAILFSVKYVLPRWLTGRWKLLGNTGPLVLLLIATPIAYVYSEALTAAGIAITGEIPAGLPGPTTPFPTVEGTQEDIQRLVLAAIPCVLIGYMESLAISRTLARQYGPYPLDESQEMFAIGASNIAVALARGYPVTGSFSRSAVNAGSGARTQVSGVVAAALLALAVGVMTPLLQYLPKVALSSIVLVVVVRLVEPGEAVALYRVDRADFWIALVTFFVTVFVDVAPGLICGVSLHWLVTLLRAFPERSEVTLFAWVRGEATIVTDDRDFKGSLNGAGALGSANVDMRESGREPAVWSRLSSIGELRETDPNAPCAVLLKYGPDITFAQADRIKVSRARMSFTNFWCMSSARCVRYLFPQQHVEEALACYRPRVLMMDAHAWQIMDSAGASAILQLAHDTRRTCNLVLVQPPPAIVAKLQAAVRAHGFARGAKVDHDTMSEDVEKPLLNHNAASGTVDAHVVELGDLRCAASMLAAEDYARRCCLAVRDAYRSSAAVEAGSGPDDAPVKGVPESNLTARFRDQRHAKEPFIRVHPESEHAPIAGQCLPFAFDSLENDGHDWKPNNPSFASIRAGSQSILNALLSIGRDVISDIRSIVTIVLSQDAVLKPHSAVR